VNLSLSNPKVCIFTETYHPVIGGGETQARALAESLVSNGFPVIVLTRRSDASLQKFERSGGVTVYRLPPVGKQHLKKWGLLLSSIPALIKLCRHYDLILVSGFRVTGMAGVMVGKLLGKHSILKADSLGEMSGEFFTAGLAKWRLRPASVLVRIFLLLRNMIVKRADAFVAISSAVKGELAIHGVNRKAVHMIPNSVDTELFHPVSRQERQEIRAILGLPSDDMIVTFTGRLVSYKGLPLLLRVWQEIQRRHANVSLLLVGSGGLDIHNSETELKEFVTANCLEHSIRFIGGVHNVYEYLQASDLFVFPTESEAFGISLIEAMACGLPVVSTSVGGIRDILQHRVNGLAVNPGDFQELYDALDTLLTDHALADNLGRAARQTVEEKYSETSVTAKYVALFRSIVDLDPS
jgi:glycosyltransferase involved in cell wall biosynthesis